MSGSGAGPRRGGHRRSDQTAPGAIPSKAPTPGEPRSAARVDRVDRERAFVVLRSAQRALLRAEGEAELLDLICRIAVDEAGYRLAWVGLAEDDPDRTVRPVAQAGYEAGYLGSITITWADTLTGQGPTGTAIRTGRPVVGRSFLTDPELVPWREQAIQRGFASSLALPLRADDRPFGALMIYATTPNAFTAEDVELLTGLADDLAFGITMLRARAARGAAEDGLRRSERNLAEAQRVAHLGSWEENLETGLITWSDEECRIFGIEPGTFAGSNEAYFAFVHPDDLAKVTRAAWRFERRRASEREYRIIRPDGAVRIVREVGEVLRDESGHPLRIVGTTQDITEQVAAEEERARLISAVEQTADSIMIHDLDKTIRYVNPAFTRLYGYEPDEVVGRYAGLLDSGHHEPSFWTALWAFVAAGLTWSGTIVNRRKDGTLFEVESVISGIRDPAGAVTSYIQTDRDVTREHELEDRLRQAQKMEAIGQLAGGIAHDFNNILTAIRGYGELARDPAASEDQRRADLDEVVANADRAAELTGQLLAFGRRAVLRPEVLDPAAVVGGIVPLLRRLIGEHIRLVTSTAPGAGHVRVDRSQLEQVIVNLCVNARDAMPSGGRLTIATAAVELDEADAARIAEATPGSYVELAVADTGTGMDEATRAHIFEPFFTTKPTGEGTGLGLATVYGIVHQSGGTIAVASEPGKGTTFRILLPVVEAERGEASPSGTAPAAAGGSETILLVEDEAAVRGFTRRALANHGYTVLEASDGATALRLASTHPRPIDLLLTDVVMPGLAGPDLARLVSDMQPTIRVLYVSGYVASAVDHVLFDQSASLAKPFTTEALLRKVRETLDAPGEG